jgi:hypothetical protein
MRSALPVRWLQVYSQRQKRSLTHPITIQNGAGAVLLPKYLACMTETVVNSLLQLRRQFLGFIRRRVEDPAAAEDILQTAFLRLLEQFQGSYTQECGSSVG